MPLKHTAKQRKAWKLLTDRALTRIGQFGGARAGKTDIICEYLVAVALSYPSAKILMARKHLSHARRTLFKGTLKKYLSNHIDKSLYRFVESTTQFYNGSEILVDGLDDKDRTEKVLGDEFCIIYLNESTQMSYNTYQMATTRLAQVVKHGDTGKPLVNKMIVDANPRGPRHWVRKVCIEHKDPKTNEVMKNADKWGVIADWSPYDNLENLSEEYLSELEALPDVMRQRMIQGKWVDNEGCVYSDFDSETHVCKECSSKPDQCPRAKRARQIVAGVDFGFVDPFVHLWGAVDGDKRLLLFDEIYKSGVITADHAESIKERKWRVSWRVTDHDPSEAATLKRNGVTNKLADKSTKTIEGGCDLVRTRLKVQGDDRPRLEVCQYCENTIGEFYNYLMDEDKGKPIDSDNHAMDTLRYMIVEMDAKGRSVMIAIP